MKITTFNINNINRRLPNLLRWLKAAEPAIVCLQELKCAEEAFPAAAIMQAGYHAVWRGQRTWNGVAILARSAPVVTRMELPGNADDRQARYLEAAINGILIGCIYLPNGNPQPGPKFDYKLAWFRAPTKLDIYPTTSWDDDALVQPQSRAAYARLLKQGWTDAIREVHGEERVYTFWHYLRNRWERDAGLRLDHLLLSPALAPRLRAAGVDRDVRGRPGASDHAPVWIELAMRQRQRKPTR
jgi:exodeoxyribonuclease III